MEQTNNIPQQKKKSRLKLILIICVCSIIIIGLIVTGPILMQTFQVGSSNHANAALC
jgi:flagellar basal body-associated protein FliL